MDFAEKLADTSIKNNSLDEQEEILYSWEQGLVKNWERLVETESGLVVIDDENHFDLNNADEGSNIELLIHSSNTNIRRGLLRNIVIILDMTSNMLELDYKPDRLQCMVKCNEIFIKQLLEDNPLTQISVISIYDGVGEVIISYNSNFLEIMASILNYLKKGCKGSMSIQNGLEKAKYLLVSIPPYGTKEIIFFLGSMRSVDNTFLFNEWVEGFSSNNIIINAILFIPELYIIKTITKMTGGVCLCAMNNDHLLKLALENFIKPPPSNMTSTPLNINLVTMGFPEFVCNQTHPFGCSCHRSLTHHGYSCPKCKSIVCYLPTKCPVCLIYLISPNHLARSFAYLFQHPNIIPIKTEEFLKTESSSIKENCELCETHFSSKSYLNFGSKYNAINKYLCKNCSTQFCDECCKFILTTLHQCPICC
ncbi:transcription factor TFIIH with a vWA domain [Cryptosporidium sp. chipmunk genotype I]|uniref:transcription factor TFIIH with a vWA domain n=1 Tax=Cryptosporidium sp. chipmunk genotype I TaxID=1280935 RepID=UPI00351A24D4|nr:transcription factor TFIIH with a vWA domain [Cryptosporidium sp. chipmunk genotype I]